VSGEQNEDRVPRTRKEHGDAAVERIAASVPRARQLCSDIPP
jgi:hypothetical protein